MSIRVKPQERNMSLFAGGALGGAAGGGAGGMGLFRMLDPEFEGAFENMKDFDFGWAQAGPGFVFHPQDFDAEALKAQIEKMREQHRLHLDRMKEAFDLRNEALKRRNEAAENTVSRDQMRELLDEIKRLREEIESLKKERK
jgi:hypothetical protein